MLPVPVTDQELKNGIDDVTQWLPSPSLPTVYWAETVAEGVFYDALPSNVEFTPRVELDQAEATRHLYAIRASTKLSVPDKLHYMAQLITLWFKGVAYP